MGLKGVFIIGLLGICSLWALLEPFAGIVAYVTYYHTSPETTWWGAGLSAAGVRYSVVITICLATGTLLNLKRLPYGTLVSRQEALYLTFLAWLIILGVLAPLRGATFKGVALRTTDPVDKMIKMTPFLLALSHVVVTPRRFHQFSWLIVACALYLGYECFTTPGSHYVNGRLEGVGPSDGKDSNMLASHLVALLPFTGVLFLRSGWKGKLISLMAGGLVVDGMVLTRSRGGYLAIIAGAFSALILLPRRQRKHVLPLVILGVVGGATLVDAGFMERMGTLESDEREKDGSAQSRLTVWKAGLNMFTDHPLGVGPGNFNAYIGNYVPEETGRDAHSLYVRCLTDLGGFGFTLLVAMITNAFLTLAQIRRSARDRPELDDCALFAFALQISSIAYLVASIFINTLYIELLWWLLFLPSALERASANVPCELATITRPPPRRDVAPRV